jgi:hypothetical protein
MEVNTVWSLHNAAGSDPMTANLGHFRVGPDSFNLLGAGFHFPDLMLSPHCLHDPTSS